MQGIPILVLHNLNEKEQLMKNDVPYKLHEYAMLVTVKLIVKNNNEKIIYHDVTRQILNENNVKFDEIYKRAFELDEARGYTIKSNYSLLLSDERISENKRNKYKKENIIKKYNDIVYILSNPENCYGATAIMHKNIINKVLKLLDNEMYVIPIDCDKVFCVSTKISKEKLMFYKAMLINPLNKQMSLKNDVILVKGEEAV